MHILILVLPGRVISTFGITIATASPSVGSLLIPQESVRARQGSPEAALSWPFPLFAFGGTLLGITPHLGITFHPSRKLFHRKTRSLIVLPTTLRSESAQTVTIAGRKQPGNKGRNGAMVYSRWG